MGRAAISTKLEIMLSGASPELFPFRIIPHIMCPFEHIFLFKCLEHK